MLIDWFTVGAQIVNFIVLVWLLKRFLYKPITGAIDARELRIANELKDAGQHQLAARREREDLRLKNLAFDGERAALLAAAVADAGRRHEDLMTQSRAAVAVMEQQQKNRLQAELSTLGDQLTCAVAAEIFDAVRKVLKDLATADLEERMAELFVRRLRTMGPEKKALQAALAGALGAAVLRSRFDLQPAQRTVIQTAVNDAFAMAVHLRFESVSDDLCGIELVAGGQRLSWNMAQYLKVLQSNVAALLERPASPRRPAPAPATEAAPNTTAATSVRAVPEAAASGAVRAVAS